MTTFPSNYPIEMIQLFLKPLPIEGVLVGRRVCRSWRIAADLEVECRTRKILGGASPEQIEEFKELCRDVKALKGMAETSIELRLE